MDGLLTPVSTSYKSSEKPLEAALTLVEAAKSNAPKPSFRSASTPAEALELLKSEPDYDTLIVTLRYLANCPGFNIRSPSPLASQLVHVLVSEIIPNYWNVLRAGEKSKPARQGSSSRLSELDLLLSCLRSVSGINSVLLSLKRNIQQSKESKKAVGGPNFEELLKTFLQLLQALLEGPHTVETIWTSIYEASSPQSKQKAVWNEFLSPVGGGKILGITAEAEDVVNELSTKVGEKHWIADGTLFSSWLARNLTYWVKNLATDSESASKCCVELISKSFRLGYTENVVKELLTSLLLSKPEYSSHFTSLLHVLPSFEYRNFLYMVLKITPGLFLSAPVTTEDDAQWWQSDTTVVSSVATLINQIVDESVPHKDHLISWLTESSGAGLGDGIAIRRAVVAVLSRDKTDIQTVLDKSLQQFGDQLYIKHTPTLQQDAHTQVLLLAAGYVYRKTPLHLSMMMRSGAHLSAVSNRLAASSSRARFLGMVVGEALSSLVDKGDKRMDFKVDEMSTAEAKWFKCLVNVSDTVGSLEPLKSGKVANASRHPKPQVSKSKKPMAPSTELKIISIEEIETDEEEWDDDGLTPYAKPDTDAEDTDEDPTLVTRNKPTAPVYIRDLISYLRDTDNYDRQKLGLETASPLIRRKVNFGTEVTDHAEELATLLVGLQDKYEIENFQDMRLQGMIAILIALPLKMGQWFSKTFFDGDYSVSQRASVLTTLGLGARELGGFGAEDSTITSTKLLPSTSFPSKTLPSSLHNLYSGKKPTETTAVHALSTQLTNTMMAPLAADLADKLTGPAILKIRTFSSRMAVEKKRKKPMANSLAKIVADGFFFPLTGRFFIHLKAYGSSHHNVVFQPYLLALFIKTLSLLLHASGPSTLSLPQMTSEFWDLLLSLRTQSIGDITVIEALLFGFMTILEVSEDKRTLVEAHGRQMLETQEWVEGVFGRVGGGGSEEDEKVRMLAAGVLVRVRECVEKYQALLMGDLASFQG